MAFLLFFTAVILSGIAAYYSVIGLIAIFSAATLPVAIMGGSLEAAKLVVASWLYRYWKSIPLLMKAYFTSALVILMLITSMGIFGFLSKAHNDQSLVSGDVLSKLSIFDEKIKTAKENIDANRKALKQMDEAVDQVMGRSTTEQGADKAVAIRRAQAKERTRLLQEIATEQKTIAQLNQERAPIAAEVRKVEAEVGPIKYIAAMLYGDNPDSNTLERAVRWLIILLICVFDPLAVLMLIAANLTQMKQAEWKDKKPVESSGEINDNKDKNFTDEVVVPVVVEPPAGTQGADQPVDAPVDDTPAEVATVGEPVSSVYEDQQPLAKRIDMPIPVPQEEEPTPKKKVKKLALKTESPNAPGLDASIERPGDYLTPPEEPKQEPVEEQKQEAKSIQEQVDSLIRDGDQSSLETVYRQIVKELAKNNRNKSTHWGPIKNIKNG